MPDVPYPISGETIDEVRHQIYELIRYLYEEKVGGADLGDVFSITGDILTLEIASNGGLTKSDNELTIDVYSTGGLQADSNGLSVKCRSDGGLDTDSSGLGMTLANDYEGMIYYQRSV